MIKHRDIFLKSEGDRWFARNKNSLRKKNYKNDFIISAVKKLKKNNKICILEIGCGDGERLNLLSCNKKIKCFGLEPSLTAINSQKNKKIKILRGTAESIPFENKKFDILIFSFCLYLCDDEDLSKIVSEALRVTKNTSFIIIYDFFIKGIKYFKYKHNKKIKIRKMDCAKLFGWHPRIKLIEKKKYYEKKNIVFEKRIYNQTALYVFKKNFK